jgi:tonB-dependent receptor exported protein
VITDPGARYDAEGVSGIINIIMVRRVLDGYTGTVSAEVTTNEAYGGGTFVSLKAGKLGLTANYNLEYEREPIADITSFRKNLSDDANRYLSQIGEHWEREKMHRGYLEGTFEIDSMNLISVDANLFRKRQKEF